MKKILFAGLFILLVFNSFSQKYPKFGADMLMDEFTGFNFFTGPDANKFQTTPKAFGSGIYDFSGQYNVWSIWLLKPSKYPIGIATTVALKIAKFRFTDNYYFGLKPTDLLIDNDPTHYYDDSFFSRAGSKLVTGKIFIPLMIYLPVHNWFNPKKDFFGIYAGAFYDGYLFAYQKLYYETNGQLVKNKQTNGSIKQYFNKNGFGVRGGFKMWNFFVYGQYLLTPIFSDLLQYDIHETKIGLRYYFDYSEYIPDFDNDDKDKDENGFGTDAQ
ncbi:MAG: hypothetical protein JXR68_09070 [Bacteroidales bacterium]|nr:hypothetical protein [Bacteroidales bacterium]